jgi:hypothetical protein
MTADRDIALQDELSDALAGGGSPEHLPAWQFARGVVPAIPLLRALTSTASEVDTLLKLMLLFELARTPGRWPIERIRYAAPFLDAERVDSFARTLQDGGWLELRASDRSYRLSDTGLHVLQMLQVADFAGLAASNTVQRAALAAEFAARTQEGTDATAWLLDQLLVQLEDAVDEAMRILRQGRAWELIAWSRKEHGRQLDTIRQVLGFLQERVDASSREFLRIDRLHRAMAAIVRQHTGIHTRLRDWNLERLYTSEAGYAVPELAEAVLGAAAPELLAALAQGIVQERVLPPDLTVQELRARLHGARRRLGTGEDAFRYAQPPEIEVLPYEAAAIDAAAALRARLTQRLATRGPADPPLEVREWLTPGSMAAGAWDMALLSRLQFAGDPLALDDGRQATVQQPVVRSEEVPLDHALEALGERGVLQRTDDGWFARVTLELEGTEKHDG